MDDSLYDEFGNFIGTVDSDEEGSRGSEDDLDARANAYLEDEDEGERDGQVAEEQLMQVDGITVLR
jgi:hypothetical protein